ncbi:alanine--tRNA ligase [Pajaroellobacter abortibovis]|uniref:alanine--tRNA ligase n=1 Tax=Pajaroellobacter abortibovis TaxID=1882918 RepID=UPI001FEB33F8|nr:alanine--tRNA ligase [Pajaroellobacter abortibovis]
MAVTVSTSAELRTAFLNFFRSQDHHICPSAPLVHSHDPTLMFTNAGMVPFKNVFVGKEPPLFKRVSSCQKCIRISGKHNDLENVGITPRHHTFFEMLGNFSFGDYFKEETIVFAWELLTKVCALPPERLMVTVFKGDSQIGLGPDREAQEIWKKVTGFSENKIVGLGLEDNFWQMGEMGPCGPCSEIYFFLGDDPDLGLFGAELDSRGRGWVEIWNLVFMQFERSFQDVVEGGKLVLKRLPAPCVDTGAGLERLAAVVQGVRSDYDTDILRALIRTAADVTKRPYRGGQSENDIALRVIADHARTAAFLIAEGVFPDRSGREYVLRRVMRRAIRYGHRMGIRFPFFHHVTRSVVQMMGQDYPELVERSQLIEEVVTQEETRFRETLERGLKLFEEEVIEIGEQGAPVLSGKVIFKLYDTYGFPYDLTKLMASERGIGLDEQGFREELEAQRKLSEGSKVGERAIDEVWREVLTQVTASFQQGVYFTGYDSEEGEACVLALVAGGRRVDSLVEGEEAALIVDKTPFYGESGGQVGDRGQVSREESSFLFEVEDTQKPLSGLIVQWGKVKSGKVQVGERVSLRVDPARRRAIQRHHSATHLLHWALRHILGDRATQKGSWVGSERLRFDFAYGKALTHEQLAQVEKLVNRKILDAAPVTTEILSMEQAKAKRAIAIFEEKYGDRVRVVGMTGDSIELCGGTHVRSLGEIGFFKIISERGVAAGVRRIEAVAGEHALAYIQQMEGRILSLACLFRSTPDEKVVSKAEKLLEHNRRLEREISELRRSVALMQTSCGGDSNQSGIESMLVNARTIQGGKALAVRTSIAHSATLRELAERVRDKLGESAVLVSGTNGNKVSLVLVVSPSLTSRYRAGEMIKPVAQMVGGSGGGRVDMAQARGVDVEKLDEAFERFYMELQSF